MITTEISIYCMSKTDRPDVILMSDVFHHRYSFARNRFYPYSPNIFNRGDNLDKDILIYIVCLSAIVQLS